MTVILALGSDYNIKGFHGFSSNNFCASINLIGHRGLCNRGIDDSAVLRSIKFTGVLLNFSGHLYISERSSSFGTSPRRSGLFFFFFSSCVLKEAGRPRASAASGQITTQRTKPTREFSSSFYCSAHGTVCAASSFVVSLSRFDRREWREGKTRSFKCCLLSNLNTRATRLFISCLESSRGNEASDFCYENKKVFFFYSG